MKLNVERRVCDHCSKVVEQAEKTYGGSPFQGWIYLERTEGLTSLEALSHKNSWDFCSIFLLRKSIKE